MLLGLFLSVAFAAEFPAADYRAVEMRAKILLIGLELSKSGKEAKFDPAAALQSCDGIDNQQAPKFKELIERRLQAMASATANTIGWEAKVMSAWRFPDADKQTLGQALKAKLARWPVEVKLGLPCTDGPSLELIENIATDINAVDDTPFNTCVRMVKAFRGSGVCGRPVILPQ